MNVRVYRAYLVHGDITYVLFNPVELWFYVGSSEMSFAMRSIRDACRDANHLRRLKVL